jgi:hypothetical protein
MFLLYHGSATWAQDLEPRRWTHLPKGVNFFSIGGSYGDGEIFLDPVLQIEDAKVNLVTTGLSYVRSFGLFGKSARVDVRLPYAWGRWEGLVNGEYTRVKRNGFGDPRLRLSVLLYGGPAQTRAEFAKSEKSSTIVGGALAIVMPYGDYLEDKLINLGENRWIFRPQLGVTHTRGKWTLEATGSAFLYTDNDEFWDGNRLETETLYALQAHLIHTFRPGLWASLSTAYGTGAEAQVNGVDKDNPVGNWLTALSLGLPISKTQGVKLVWLRARSQKDTGSDTDSLIVGYSVMF